MKNPSVAKLAKEAGSPAKLMGKDRSKTKTKKSGKSKTVTIKDGKRAVVKRDAQGNIIKTKSGGVVTKGSGKHASSTTRKDQLKKGLKTAGKAALYGAGMASLALTPGLSVPIAKGAVGTVGATLGKDVLNAAKIGENKIKNRLKRKNKK